MTDPAAFAPPPSAAAPPLALSSKGKRFGAYLLEVVLVVVTLFIGWFVWSLVIWSKGQSPAKSLLGMRCVKAEVRQPASFGDMALREVVGRWLLGFVPFYTLVSCIVLLADDRSQALWDKVASTVVVDDPDNVFGL